jgi:hypothetical protein
VNQSEKVLFVINHFLKLWKLQNRPNHKKWDGFIDIPPDPEPVLAAHP